MSVDFQAVLASPALAYEEGLQFFAGVGMLNTTLQSLIEDLEAHGIDNTVIDGVALNQYGYQRFTHDIDLLMTSEGLEKFRTELLGRGYRPAFNGAMKTFRATEKNVPIEVITTGEYPGDGKPKPVQFPDPRNHTVVIEGIRTIELAKLIELKLASGMTSPGRLKDLADVQELIRIRQLDAEFAARLNASVQAKYLELHSGVEQDRSASRED